MLLLPHNLAGLARIASRFEGRYQLQAVRLQETADGYQIMVTDGKRLAIVQGTGRSAELPAHLAHAPKGAVEALLPAKEWGRLLKQVKGDPALAVLGDQVTTLAIGSSMSTLPHLEGRFPDVEHLARTSLRSIFRVGVDARLLAELLQVAAEFCAEGSGRVFLHFAGKDKPMLVTTENDAGQRFQAAIMPLS
jgi:DNA polymerase III sliding clamp (beta) subunit (PCNA family)